MAFDLMAEIGDLARLFDREKVEYAICGGIAVAIHGAPRGTRDLDVLIREEDAERVEKLVRECGFTLPAGIIPFRTGTPDAQQVLRISKARGEDLLTLDLLLVSPVLEDVWNGRMAVNIGPTPAVAVSKEGLIKMKSLANRPQDQIDIINLRSLDSDDS